MKAIIIEVVIVIVIKAVAISCLSFTWKTYVKSLTSS